MVKHKYKELPLKINTEGAFLAKIVSFFTKKSVIVLTDYKGDKYFTFARAGCKCGKLHCNVYWSSNAGDVILEENGLINEESDSGYINSWEYLKK